MTNSENKWKWLHFRLLACSVGAGLLSSILNPSGAIWAILLAVSLSSGIILINHFSGKRLNEGKSPTMGLATGTGALSGFFAGLIIALCAMIFGLPRNLMHGSWSPPLGGWAAILLCLTYGIALNFPYALRGKLPRRFRGLVTVFLLAGAGLFCGFLRVELERSLFGGSPNEFDNSLLMPFFALFGGLPFAIFWGIAVISADPAWTIERWHQKTQSN